MKDRKTLNPYVHFMATLIWGEYIPQKYIYSQGLCLDYQGQNTPIKRRETNLFQVQTPSSLRPLLIKSHQHSKNQFGDEKEPFSLDMESDRWSKTLSTF